MVSTSRLRMASTLIRAGCGASPAPTEPYAFRCPSAGRGDDVDHVLRRRLDLTAVAFPTSDERSAASSPYLTYRGPFHAYWLARAGGIADEEYCALVERLDAEVARVDGHGFRPTPFARADELSRRMGFGLDGGVWVKDETGNVSGPHKARHLFGLLVYLEVAERLGLADAGRRPHLDGLAVESGFTLGYELAADLRDEPPLDRLVVQVGGGALASACVESLGEAVALGVLARMPRFHAVQTEGAWPLARAFQRLTARLPFGAGADERTAALRYAATHRSEFMWPWESEPHSIAYGILDDETYDWLAVVEGLFRTDGGPVVVGEELLARANTLAVDATDVDVDPTGSSGLAGLLALRERGEISDHERVAVLFTGIRR